FLVVRNDHPPDTFVARRDDAPEGDVATREGLQLERNVLEDVGEVRAIAQSLDEAADAAAAARMLVQRRQGFEQAIGEVRQIGRGHVLQSAESDITSNYWSQAPVIGAAERSNARHADLVGIVGS